MENRKVLNFIGPLFPSTLQRGEVGLMRVNLMFLLLYNWMKLKIPVTL